jgi:hypothetical protein
MLLQVGRILEDHRTGGITRYHIGPDKSLLMRVTPEIPKCVAFLGYRQLDGKERLLGTVFFVAVPLTGREDERVLYAVTAKHNIDKIIEKEAEQLSDGYVIFRMNLRDGVKRFKNRIDRWHFHPDLSVDVAVCHMQVDGTDHMAYPLESFVTDDLIEELGIGVGEDVFLSGLFFRHTETTRNVPILRVGNIAAMKGERVKGAKKFGLMEAYLIEVRSFGGLSGSPVFVHLGIVRHFGGVRKFSESPEGVFYLLGLVHGHWDLLAPNMDVAAIDHVDIEYINTGIAIVVPSGKIREVLYLPELEKERKNMAQELNDEGAAIMDSFVEDEKPFAREDFEDALRKVSRPESKIEPRDSD